MANWELLKLVHLFAGLDQSELEQVASICTPREVAPAEIIVAQNTTGNEMFIIAKGSAEVFIEGLANERVLVVLGKGQVVGEMALLDQGYRSASVRATSEGCLLYLLDQKHFEELARSNLRIGYFFMRNLASDLAFKLRHRNLAQM
ncbi:MAG: cyclic nucleotide-binding domain-containing protein [Chloroflexi bacterium]|nr:cyclic nucleotide-binding domain-containing protein [Chloroflexota bacterium]MCI0580991.1 cyclic nucleotide-binding domain-containing protein [Chloroflexota bacterium]MCI0646330.1 cyclic nucleotide-binding domain-containing protein [Chloroflexota bacterium]MCI0726972.1 cyclic nucleotide-binding domain-containing protein [Chloroflexota bacterium]